MTKPVLVLCLGNEILSDDGAGIAIANLLERDQTKHNDVEVVGASIAGFALLDLLRDRKSVLVIDSILTGKDKPGTVSLFNATAFVPTYQLINSHQISLPNALQLGEKFGIPLPKAIDILTIESEDVTTLHEGLTTSVKAAIPHALTEAKKWIEGHSQ